MSRRSKKIIICSLIIILSIVFIPFTFSKYVKTVSKNISLTITQPTYIVRFHSNYNDGQTETTYDQNFVYNVSQRLTANSFEHSTLHFAGWNTKANGTGTKYTDKQSVKNLTSTNNGVVHLYAQWSDWIAEVNGTKYTSLQDAITAVPNNTQTTVTVLVSTSEHVNIPNTKNIVLDLQGFTLSNNQDKAVIENAGTLSISNGTITSNAPKNAVINNTGTLNVSGGEIIATGDRQAIYNNGGTTIISGDAYLSSSTDQRATVHNLNKGTLIIKGGTIISSGFYAVNNPITNGVLVIGEKDGVVSKTSPLIQGITYGINSSKGFEYHDGVIKGTTKPVNNELYAEVTEVDYARMLSTETIGGVTYNTMKLGIPLVITYNANGGNAIPSSVNVEKNEVLNSFVIPTRAGYQFDGWFTEADGGTEITTPYVVTDNVEMFAHWTKIKVARIGTTEYDYVKDAITAAGTTQTTIEIIIDNAENITIGSTKNITLDLQGHTLSNDGNSSVIKNSGTLVVKNGTITSNADTGAIDNDTGGNLIIDNGARIVATGSRQAIYNLEGGYVEIKEGSYLSSVTSGKPTTSELERATVQNLPGGVVVITGGEIVNTVQQAISNEGEMTIGVKDGTISATSPVIKGETYAIHNIGTLNIYDGVFKGITGIINGSVTDTENDTHIVDSTETIDSKTYIVEYYEFD